MWAHSQCVTQYCESKSFLCVFQAATNKLPLVLLYDYCDLQAVKLTIYLHGGPRLRMNGAILLLPLYVFMACEGSAVLLVPC